METITLANYLEKTANPKRAAKLVKRSVKLFRHATKDLAHAECDLAHAKEDCLHTIEAYENCLDDTKQYLAGWVKDAEEIDAETEETEEEDDDALFSEDFEDKDEGEDERLGDHLEHAASDFKHAMKDASHALESLEEIDENVEELIEDADEEGFRLTLSDIRAEIVRRATESAKEELPAGEFTEPQQEMATA